jgi:hypothetical protein
MQAIGGLLKAIAENLKLEAHWESCDVLGGYGRGDRHSSI